MAAPRVMWGGSAGPVWGWGSESAAWGLWCRLLRQSQGSQGSFILRSSPANGMISGISEPTMGVMGR